MDLRPAEKRFLVSIFRKNPDLKQPEIFQRLKVRFGHAVPPRAIKQVRDELGLVAPTVRAKAAPRRKPGRPPKAAAGAAGQADHGAKAPPSNGRRKKAPPTNGRRKEARAAQAAAATAAPAAVPPTAPATPAPRKGRGRRAIDQKRVTFDHLPTFFVVAIGPDGAVHPFQTTSKSLARRRIDELINQGYREEEIGFYSRSPFQVKATVRVKF